MKLLSLFLLFILPLSLAAEDSEWFVGIDGGVTGAKFTSKDINVDRSYGAEYGAKIGLRDKNGRIYLGYAEAKEVGDEIKSSKTPYIALEGVSDEFTVIAKSTAKFFFGMQLGAAIADINDKTVTAFMGGLQTGLDFQLPANFEIELGGRYYFTYKETATNFNAFSLYGGLNYKFYAF